MSQRHRFQSLDKSFYALTLAPWSSFAPTWRLEYRGTLGEAELVQALQWLLERYPWCAARVASLAWVLPERLDARALLKSVDARGQSEAERVALEQAEADRFL